MLQHPRLSPGRAWLSLAALLLIGGCGMYGDLYLEEPEAPAPPEVEERPPIATEPVPGEAPADEEQADKPKQPPDEPRTPGRQ